MVLASIFTGSGALAGGLCPRPWKGAAGGDDCAMTTFKLGFKPRLTSMQVVPMTLRKVEAPLRNGYLEENPNVPFKGNIVYFEGLGDSMVNQMPLFKRLTDEGYRVIAFDYPGQGGSGGTMNDTRIADIWKIGNTLFNKYAREPGKSKKILLGWSTGGLAAYDAALSRQADAIVQIAPGNAANVIVGENNWFRGVVDRITLPTLTTAVAEYRCGAENPHLDGIRPDSPVKIPAFALNLQWTAAKDSYLRRAVDRKVCGMVLLSGSNDSYVNAERTRAIMSRKASHFRVRQYAGSLHEIQNETESADGDATAGIADRARNDIVQFLSELPERPNGTNCPAI